MAVLAQAQPNQARRRARPRGRKTARFHGPSCPSPVDLWLRPTAGFPRGWLLQSL